MTRFVIHYDAGKPGTYRSVIVDDYETRFEVEKDYIEVVYDHFWKFNDKKDFEEKEPEFQFVVEEYLI